MRLCSRKCIKSTLYSFIVVFGITGIVLLGLGAYVTSRIAEFDMFAERKMYQIPITLMVLGGIIIGVAILGAVGTYKEMYTAMVLFALGLLILSVAELAVGISSFIYKKTFEDNLWENLKKSTMKYNPNAKDIVSAWDKLQTMYQCCGTDDIYDWEKAGLKTPKTCFKDGKPTPKGSNLIKEGCLPKLSAVVRNDCTVIMAFGFCFCIFEIFGIVFAIMLTYILRKEYLESC